MYPSRWLAGFVLLFSAVCAAEDESAAILQEDKMWRLVRVTDEVEELWGRPTAKRPSNAWTDSRVMRSVVGSTFASAASPDMVKFGASAGAALAQGSIDPGVISREAA